MTPVPITCSTALPPEVATMGRRNARRAGIDEPDAISLTAQAWVEHPDMWRLVAYRRCVDHRRSESGQGAADRRPLLVLDEPGLDEQEESLLDGVIEAGFKEIEDQHDLASILAPLPDEDLARLARVYWLGMRVTESDDDHKIRRSLKRAKFGAKIPRWIRMEPDLPPPPPVFVLATPVEPCLLTEKELAVVRALAEGMSTSEVGEHLGLSPYTIKTHIARITKRLGTKNGTHIVATCLRAGWIS